MANEAPERIWANPDAGYCTTVGESTYTAEYIRADLAALSSEQARDALTELDQLRDRVKELEKALGTFDGALDDEGNPDEITKPDNLTIYPCGYITYGDLRTARRVREGGKVDG